MVGILFWFLVLTIAYTYAGYPLLLWLLARMRRVSGEYSLATPPVTLLIAAYNEEAVIGQKLENSLSLDYPMESLQIIVAADGSDDETPAIVSAYKERGVELSYHPARRGKMAAINRAMPRVRGEIVVFSDANNQYRRDVIRELVKPFADPAVGAVTGAKLIAQDNDALAASESLYWKYEAFIKKQETRLGSCTGVAGEILAIRPDIYTPPPDHIINDDFYLAMSVARKGFRVVYAPGACSFEHISLSARDEVTRRTRIVAGRYQAISLAHKFLPMRRPLMVWQVFSHKFLRPLVPLAMLGALVTNVVAVVWPPQVTGSHLFQLAHPFNWTLLSLQLLFYGLAWLGNHVEIDNALGKLLYLPTFLVNSNLAAMIGLIRFLSGRQTALWERVNRREGIENPR